MLYQLSYLTVRPASPTASSSELGCINLCKELIGVKTGRPSHELRTRRGRARPAPKKQGNAPRISLKSATPRLESPFA